MRRTSPLASCVLLLVTQAAPAFTDANSNSLNDDWEKAWNNGNLFPSSFDPQADPDGDGWKNLTESIAGTNPFDSRPPTGIILPEISATPATYEPVPPGEAPAEPPPEDPNAPVTPSAATTPILLDPSVVTLTWPTIPGKTYRALISDNLLTWAPASETFLGTGVPMTYQTEPLNTDGSIPGKLFWRIETADTDSDGDTLTDYEEQRRNLNAFSPDTDQDGIPDGTDSAPLISATLADPDGLGLANANLLTGLKANWTFEETTIPIAGLFGKNEARCENHAPGTSPSWPVLVPFSNSGIPAFLRRGFVSRGIPLADKSIFGDAKVFTGITNTFTLSFWHRFQKDSIRNGNSIYKCLWSLSDCRPSQSLIKSNTLAIRRKNATEEEIYLGAYTWDGSGGNPDSTILGKTFTRPLGTADDGKWHHYTIIRSAGKYTLLIDGATMPGLNDATTPWLTIPLNKPTPTQFEDYNYDWNTFGRMAPSLAQNQTTGTFDRIRLWSRPLDSIESLALFREDIDNDGLWDATENNTEIWYDLDGDNTREQGEYQFRSSPQHWENTARDTDGDGITDLAEQNTHQTDIAHPDTDGDLLPDGWEIQYSLNPLSPTGTNGKDGDPDGDGATNLQEYGFASDPTVIDTDADGISDGGEIANGSNPSDSRDNGLPLPAEKSVTILLGVGDQSGSNSEDYNLNIFRIDPLTGAEFRFHTHRSGGHGSYLELPRSIFHKGETYTFQIDWQSSTQGSSGYDPNAPGKGPDYDYTLKIQPQTDYLGKLIGSYDPATGTTDPNNPLTAIGANNVAATQAEFEANYENRRAAIVAPKLEWQAIEGFDNLDTHIDPWSTTNEAKGKRIFPCRKNPDDKQIRHKLRLVATGGLKGIQCYVRSFDIDDSTNEAFDKDTDGILTVIDRNHRSGDDNQEDYLGTALSGQFWTGYGWGGNNHIKDFDATGRANFDFRVGMQPGNNYRAVASVAGTDGFTAVEVANHYSPTYLGAELAQDAGAIVSEPLTVWRRLWVENDSMAAIPTDQFGYKLNNLTSGGGNQVNLAHFSLQPGPKSRWDSPLFDDISSFLNLENGIILFNSVYYPITESGPVGTDLLNHWFQIEGNFSQVTEGTECKIYDDDGYGIATPALPRNDLVKNELISVYRKAFVECVDAIAYNPRKTVSFLRNEAPISGIPIAPIYGVWDDALDLFSSETLWIASLVVGYQGNQNEDRDPEAENPLEGGTPGNSGRYSVIFVETIRDVSDERIRNPSENNQNLRDEIEKYIKLTAAHEIGHMPSYSDGNSHHSEFGLMGPDGYGNGQEFSPSTILRFRKTNNWVQK